MKQTETQVPETAAPAPPDYAYPKEHEWLENYAINAFGWAIAIPEGVDKRNPTVLTAMEPETSPNTPWELASKVMRANNEQPWRISFSLTPEERNENFDNRGLGRYLLVGFTMTNLGPEHFKAPSTPPCPRSLSNTKNHWGPWICQPTIVGAHASRAMTMVVTRVEHSRPEKTFLYALLKPTAGISRCYRVSRNECFYLPRFRQQFGCVYDSQNRLGAWNDCVAGAATLPSPVAPVSAQPALPVDEAAKDSEAEVDPSADWDPLSRFVYQHAKECS
ncbi:hypothetical protein C8A01DRAFT_13005 [Parachaetomium inaequale]|uniref:Uncharacterized protein n=1 Tax=Parachaetomium inaequale TaxID=2588326 RepID=A0AAN6SUC8_9PEZI|nr:hypothetical protein C8A01DRAFT_13005 [Parachaetomium inaequale]